MRNFLIVIAVSLTACSSSQLENDELLDEAPGEVDAGAPDDTDAAQGEVDGGVDGGGGSGTTGDLCTGIINAERAEYGLGALGRWPEIDACAAGQAQSDADAGELGSAFGECNELGQSTCYLTDPGASEEEFLVTCVGEMLAGGASGGNPLASTEHSKLACGTFQDAGGTWWMAADLR